MGILLKIFQLLGAKFAKEVVVFTLFKTFIASLVLVAFPIAMSSALTILYTGIHERVLSYASDEVSSYSGSSSLQSVLIHVVGLTAFFVNHLNLIESFNVVLSAIALRVTLSFIPFIRF